MIQPLKMSEKDLSPESPSKKMNNPSNKPIKKLSKTCQIMQNFFLKSALIIIQSRMSLPPVFIKGTKDHKTNKWFNLETDDSDLFRESLRPWKSATEDNLPSPLIIETYLDLKDIPPNSSLILVDKSNSSHKIKFKGITPQAIVLERWIIELSPRISKNSPPDSPIVYKNATVLLRSLYTFTRLQPSFYYNGTLAQSHLPLKTFCKIINPDSFTRTNEIGLTQPLIPSSKPTTETFSFRKIESSLGIFNIQVASRKDANFFVKNNTPSVNQTSIPLVNKYPSSISSIKPSNPTALITPSTVASSPDNHDTFPYTFSSSADNQQQSSQPQSSQISLDHAYSHSINRTAALTSTESAIHHLSDNRLSQNLDTSVLNTASQSYPLNDHSQSTSVTMINPFKNSSFSSSPSSNIFQRQSSLSKNSNINSSISSIKNQQHKLGSSPSSLPSNNTPNECSSSFKTSIPNRFSSSFCSRDGNTIPSQETNLTNLLEKNNLNHGLSALLRNKIDTPPERSENSSKIPSRSNSYTSEYDQDLDNFMKAVESHKPLKSLKNRDTFQSGSNSSSSLLLEANDSAISSSLIFADRALSNFHRMKESHSMLTELLTQSVLVGTDNLNDSKLRPNPSGIISGGLSSSIATKSSDSSLYRQVLNDSNRNSPMQTLFSNTNTPINGLEASGFNRTRSSFSGGHVPIIPSRLSEGLTGESDAEIRRTSLSLKSPINTRHKIVGSFPDNSNQTHAPSSFPAAISSPVSLSTSSGKQKHWSVIDNFGSKQYSRDYSLGGSSADNINFHSLGDNPSNINPYFPNDYESFSNKMPKWKNNNEFKQNNVELSRNIDCIDINDKSLTNQILQREAFKSVGGYGSKDDNLSMKDNSVMSGIEVSSFPKQKSSYFYSNNGGPLASNRSSVPVPIDGFKATNYSMYNQNNVYRSPNINISRSGGGGGLNSIKMDMGMDSSSSRNMWDGTDIGTEVGFSSNRGMNNDNNMKNAGKLGNGLINEGNNGLIYDPVSRCESSILRQHDSGSDMNTLGDDHGDGREGDGINIDDDELLFAMSDMNLVKGD